MYALGTVAGQMLRYELLKLPVPSAKPVVLPKLPLLQLGRYLLFSTGTHLLN